MERGIILLLFFSPLSFAGDNTTTIITKGSGSTITSKQVGNGNATNILCGANSNGSFPGTTYVSHTCSNANWSSTITGNSNSTRLYTVWSNNMDNNYTISVDGDDNFVWLDQDEDDNTFRYIVIIFSAPCSTSKSKPSTSILIPVTFLI